ncbi:MAG: hypothetical protein ACJAQ3_002538 [Planctomycetota bacterium]
MKLDADNDSSGGPPHPKGNPWGPSALGLYCTGDPPPTGAPGPHPYLDCDVLPAREQTPWPFPAPAAKGKTLEFEAWQAQQFDETLQVPANTVVGRILAGWNMCVRVVRVIKEIFSRNPRVSMIRLRARACGYKPTGRTRNVTGNLEATLEVFPSDSFEFSVTTSAFAGLDYSREVVRSDASNPVAETGQAQYDSSGSKDQVEDTESFTMRSAFGAVKDTHSVTKIEGTGGGADKSLVIIEDVKQRGFTTDIHRATDASHDNTFQGEAYTLDFNQTKQTDISGVKTGGSLSFSETGKMVDRTDETGAIRDNDDYRADGDFQSGSFDYTGADRAGTDRVTRVPPHPSTFFPLCPVDISFKRATRGVHRQGLDAAHQGDPCSGQGPLPVPDAGGWLRRQLDDRPLMVGRCRQACFRTPVHPPLKVQCSGQCQVQVQVQVQRREPLNPQRAISRRSRR